MKTRLQIKKAPTKRNQVDYRLRPSPKLDLVYSEFVLPTLAESMQIVPFPARPARGHYRQELCHLTYVVLDAGNGGIIRNLNRDGAAVQAVAPLRPQQRVRLRFELRGPRVRVETYGHVSWAHSSGQCGIRFEELPCRTGQQIDEWIFSNLLDAAARQAADSNSRFVLERQTTGRSGSTMSALGLAPIQLETEPVTASLHTAEPIWLSRPLSGKTLARVVDGLVMFAALLLFALLFLSIVHDLPPWPLTLGALVCAVVCSAGAYWGVFTLFGEATLGARLAEAASGPQENEANELGEFR
jgi:hypothetical protein